MNRLLYSERCLEDLDGILTFIANDNPDAAVELGEGMIATCELLTSHPELGASRDDLAPGVRMFVHRKYGIYYRYQKHMISIERILHPSLDVTQQRFD